MQDPFDDDLSFNSNETKVFGNLLNPTSDPFAGDDLLDDSNSFKVHLRIQKRNGRKSITIIEGLPAEVNVKKILKIIRKEFNCSGSIQKDSEDNHIIQLSGDQREKVAKFFVEENVVENKECIIMHGF